MERATALARRARHTPFLIAGALLGAAALWAARAVSSPAPLLASLDAVVAPLADACAALVEGGRPQRLLPALLGLLVLPWLWLLRRPEARRGAPVLAAACAIAWLGQSLLLSGAGLAGAACFAVALSLCALVWRPQPPPAEAPLSLAFESVAVAGFIAFFVAASLYRIDLEPQSTLDEHAYFVAARMQAGDLEAGTVLGAASAPIYQLPRFQAQPAPHWLQSAALQLFGVRLTSLRISSLLCAGAALLLFGACVRARWGPRAALLALGCSVAAPLLLAYARRGYYLAATELHAVACFALLVRFERLRTKVSAALLGGLLGASITFYQLSWFVAPLCAACLLATPSLFRRRHLPLLGALLAAALVVALPAAWTLRDGLRQVYAQSVDKLAAEVQDPDGEAGPARAATLLHPGVTPQALRAVLERCAARDLKVTAESFGLRYHALVVAGSAEAVEAAVAELGAEGWQVRGDETLPQRARGMLAQLFAGPAPEQSRSWVSGPVLDPVMAPLVLLGVAVAWRRRGDTLCRYLAVWVGLAWLVPGLVAGALPRRAVLMVPFAFALAARVLLEATRPPADSRAWRRAAALARAALVALALASGAGFFFGTWVASAPFGLPAAPTLLAFEDVVRALPAKRPILVTKLVGNASLLERSLRRAGVSDLQLEPLRAVPTPTHVRRASCRHEPPFGWLTLDTPEQRTAFEALAADHELARFANGGLLGVRVLARARGACGGMPAGRPIR